jgi:hypothetical protein
MRVRTPDSLRYAQRRDGSTGIGSAARLLSAD